jgi:hypothetical protein
LGNLDFVILESGIGKKVKSTWQNSQIAMWTSRFGKVNLRNRTSEVGKIAKQWYSIQWQQQTLLLPGFFCF